MIPFKYPQKASRFILTLCLLISVMSFSVHATESCSVGWDDDAYYSKLCLENGDRDNFFAYALAGRNSENRDNATRRKAGAGVWISNYQTLRVTLSVKDWNTGADVLNTSGEAEVTRFINYSSPISVFVCAEASSANGDYVCVYPTSIGW